MAKESFSELRELRLLYEREKQEREEYYLQGIKDAEENYKRSLKLDFVDEFKEKFEVSLVSLEELYDELVEIYSFTKGLTFSVTGYVAKLAPRTIKKGGVEEHFDMLVSECKGALDDIDNNLSPEDDIEPIKSFCQGLVDLRYIVANARRLIEEAGNAEQKKQDRLNYLKEQIQVAKDTYNSETLFENFDCYKKLQSYRNKIMKNCEIVNGSMLSNDPIKCRNDFKFLMGFHTENIPEEDMAFAINVLGIDSSAFATNPIFFDLKPGHTSLLINAPSRFFSDLEFDDLIRNIYFSFASNIPARDLLIAGVEHESVTDSVLGSLENKIKLKVNEGKSEDGIYRPIAKKDDEIASLFSDITALTNIRSTNYRSSHVRDIFAYNELDSMSTDFYLLYLVNFYPRGFNPTRINGAKELRRMATDNGNKGVITIICQATDEEYSEAMPMLTAEELGADVIDIELITNPRTNMIEGAAYRYNKEPATLNICAPRPHFDENTYWKNYKKYFQTASTVWLYDILEKFNEKPNIPYYEQISIPIGFSGGVPFEFSMKTCDIQDFGIVTGKSGSGKSSFLHTIILSAASRYSPDELRIRLVDFKADADSPEFSQYKYVKGKENLYLPHVDYLMVNGKSESALDLFRMIKNIKTERTKIMNELGCSEFNRYNKKVDDLNDGKHQKLPFLLYIIDEYNAMINGDEKNGKRSSSVRQSIIDAIYDTVRTVRSYGVGVLFSGQALEDDMDEALKQMDTRIALMNNSLTDYNALMGNKPDREEGSIDLAYLRGKGYSVFSLNAGQTRRKVRHAYAGFTGCDEQIEFTKKIREKYGKTTQVIAGSEDEYLIENEAAIDEVTVLSERKEGDSDKYFNIPLGVASASMIKTCLQYSTSISSLNYFAFADVSKLYTIERNAIFGYLNEMENMGIEKKQVYYLADNNSATQCLGKYLNDYPQLNQYLTFKKSYAEIAKQISDLYDLYVERKERKQNEVCKFEPIFVVLHDIEWLSDGDDSWVERANSDDENQVVVEREETQEEISDDDAKLMKEIEDSVYSNKAYAKFNDKMKRQVIENTFKEIKGNSISKPKSRAKNIVNEVTHRSDRTGFTIDDYMRRFITLFSRGNRMEIYVLVSSVNYPPISKCIINQLDSNEAEVAVNKCSIYGSEREYAESMRDELAVSTCAYVSLSKTKVRLYSYEPTKNNEFWDKFVSKLK